jgi:alpha-tubulin suppressor-like RCC1 family protein
VSAALLADGTVRTWGHSVGPHGRPLKDDTPVPTPTLVPGATGLRAFAIGSEHAVARTRTGAVVSWGNRRLGERGHPGIAPAAIPALDMSSRSPL